jgi:large subunit ribosomal protein L25
MELIKMQANSRAEATKPSLNACRKKGYIPAVMYGGEKDNLLLALDGKLWTKLFAEHSSGNIIMDLIIDDNQDTPELIKVGEVQRHPVHGAVLHIDLIRLNREAESDFEVPIKFTGRSEGEKAGGVFIKHLDTIDVRCLPGNVPDFIEIDVTSFGIESRFFVRNVISSQINFKIVTDEDEIIFAIEVPKMGKVTTAEEDAAAAAAEAAEGEEEEKEEEEN